jgi:hypothetical protein
VEVWHLKRDPSWIQTSACAGWGSRRVKQAYEAGKVETTDSLCWLVKEALELQVKARYWYVQSYISVAHAKCFCVFAYYFAPLFTLQALINVWWQNMGNNIIHVYSMVPPKTLNKNQYQVFLTNSHTVLPHVFVPNIRESPQTGYFIKYFANILTVWWMFW